MAGWAFGPAFVRRHQRRLATLTSLTECHSVISVVLALRWLCGGPPWLRNSCVEALRDLTCLAPGFRNSCRRQPVRFRQLARQSQEVGDPPLALHAMPNTSAPLRPAAARAPAGPLG